MVFEKTGNNVTRRDELFDTSTCWAIRLSDKMEASSVEEAGDGQALFKFNDNTMYHSSTTLYSEAHQAMMEWHKKGGHTATQEDIEILKMKYEI